MKKHYFQFILEFKPENKTYVLLPSVILFLRGSEGNFIDITFGWLCFAFTIRKL